MARKNKPTFLKKDWHKLIRLGSTVKKNRKWRGAKGRQNKIRLERRGQQARPKIGWSNTKNIRGKINGMNAVRVETIKELVNVKNGSGIIVGRVGQKKKKEIIAKANEMKLKILNKYRGANDAVGK
ncbi:MAG: eL32 family ribosomal protein [Nanoarchaeota archaeon]|nr:eL32 family ribosomal protein [Nanoarchaeota archaeon]